MADDFTDDPFYRNPPLAPPPTATTTTPTTTSTTTTSGDSRFDAYAEIVQRWRANRLDPDELGAFTDLRASGRTAEWDQRLGLPPFDPATAPPPPADASGEPPPDQGPVTVIPGSEGTPASAFPPPPSSSATPGAGYQAGFQARGREIMPRMVEETPQGIRPREGPYAAAEAMYNAGRLPGTAIAQAVQSGAEALGASPETSGRAGDVTQTTTDAAYLLALTRLIPGISRLLGLPRQLTRLPGTLRSLEEAESIARATSNAARTITRIPPGGGSVPPGTTIH